MILDLCDILPSIAEVYTLSLHDALPISRAGQAAAEAVFLKCAMDSGRRRSPRRCGRSGRRWNGPPCARAGSDAPVGLGDRKSTRLNSSHTVISYAVFCLTKKNENNTHAA